LLPVGERRPLVIDEVCGDVPWADGWGADASNRSRNGAGQLEMVQVVFVVLSAGAATALLFVSVVSALVVSRLLFCFAPLPILIAALGWTHWAGLAAAFVAAAGLGFVAPSLFLAVLPNGIGAWWLGYLALLARPGPQSDPAALEWYPVGRLVVWAALIATLLMVAVALQVGADIERFRADLRVLFERFLQAQSRKPDAEVLDVLVLAAPPMAAMFLTFTHLLNLWLAGRIVKVSGRLRRPWPDIAAMQLPGFTPWLLLAAIAGGFLPGLVGFACGVLAATLLMAYAVLGFAVLHAITRGMDSRGVVLAGVYAVVGIFHLPLLVMTLVGIAETLLDLRARIARSPGPPTMRT
jgi:Predicted membrane protein (DUF2232)